MPCRGAVVLTRPTPVAPRRALFPGGDGETHCPKVHSNHPSKLACTSLFKGRLGCFQLRASDEHRLSKNTMGLVCALGEQRKLPSLPIHYFAEPSSDRLCSLTHRSTYYSRFNL